MTAALVWTAVAVELAACVGLALGPTHYDRLHHVSLAAVLPPALLAAAVAVDQGSSTSTWNAILVALLLLLLNSLLTHATGRAARKRDFGSVQALPEERNG